MEISEIKEELDSDEVKSLIVSNHPQEIPKTILETSCFVSEFWWLIRHNNIKRRVVGIPTTKIIRR